MEETQKWTSRTFKDEEAKEYTIHRDDKPDVHFVGWLMGEEEESFDNIGVCKTKAGKYVCYKKNRTLIIHPEYPLDRANIDVREFFGMGRVAKRLYALVGIDCHVEEIK